MRVALAGASYLLACASAPPPAPGATAPGPTASYSKQLERAALERNVENGLPRMRLCYERERALDPEIERHMALCLYVMPSGKVEDVSVVNVEDAADPDRPSRLTNAITRCVRVEVIRWQFPATAWHGDVRLNQPPIFVVTFSPKPSPVPRWGSKPEDLAIAAVIRGHVDEVEPCFHDYAVGTPGAGDLDVGVRFVILPSGAVSEATIAQPARLDAQLAGCLLGVIRAMKFETAEKDRPKTITFPFRLRLD